MPASTVRESSHAGIDVARGACRHRCCTWSMPASLCAESLSVSGEASLCAESLSVSGRSTSAQSTPSLLYRPCYPGLCTPSLPSLLYRHPGYTPVHVHRRHAHHVRHVVDSRRQLCAEYRLRDGSLRERAAPLPESQVPPSLETSLLRPRIPSQRVFQIKRTPFCPRSVSHGNITERILTRRISR